MVLVGVVAVVGVVGMIALSSSGDGSDLQRVTVLAGCREELASTLRDPDSLTLEDDVEIEQGEDEPHGWMAIGTYRARNGFGGMNDDLFTCVADADGSNIEIITGEQLDDAG